MPDAPQAPVTSAGRIFAVATPGLMGSQPFAGGQSESAPLGPLGPTGVTPTPSQSVDGGDSTTGPAGGAVLVCIETFVLDVGDGRATVIRAGQHVLSGDAAPLLAPDRFVDASAAYYPVAR